MMTAQTRLRVCVAMVILSVVYGILIVALSPQVASAIGIGYGSIILTAMLLLNVWKKP